LALRGVGPECEAESVGFHGRRIPKWARKSITGRRRAETRILHDRGATGLADKNLYAPYGWKSNKNCGSFVAKKRKNSFGEAAFFDMKTASIFAFTQRLPGRIIIRV
jgi:hypothetical protein